MERLIELRSDIQYRSYNPRRVRRKHHANWTLADDSLRSSALVRPTSKGRNKAPEMLKLPSSINTTNAIIHRVGTPGSLNVPPSPTVLITPNSASSRASSPGAAPAPASPVTPDAEATSVIAGSPSPSDAKSVQREPSAGTDGSTKKATASGSATNSSADIITKSGVKMSSAAAPSPSLAHTSSSASSSLAAPAQKLQYRLSASKSALQAKKLALQIKELQIQQRDLLKASSAAGGSGAASVSGSAPPSPIMPHTPNTPAGPPPASPLPPIPHSKSYFAQAQQDATARHRDKPLPATHESSDPKANGRTMSEEEEDEDILPLVNVRERDRERDRDRDSVSSRRRRANSASRQQTHTQPQPTGTANGNHHQPSDPSSSSPDRKSGKKSTSKPKSTHSNATTRPLDDSQLLGAPLVNGSQLGHSTESLFSSSIHHTSNRRRTRSNPSTTDGASKSKHGKDASRRAGGSSIGSGSEEDSDEYDNKSDVDHLRERDRDQSMDLERDSLNLPASIARARVFDTRRVQARATTMPRPMTAFSASASGHAVGGGRDLFPPGGRITSFNPGGGGGDRAGSAPWSGWTISELRNSAATDTTSEEVPMPANLPDWNEVERGGPTSLPIHQIQRDLDFSMRRLINIQVFEECALPFPFSSFLRRCDFNRFLPFWSLR